MRITSAINNECLFSAGFFLSSSSDAVEYVWVRLRCEYYAYHICHRPIEAINAILIMRLFLVCSHSLSTAIGYV